MRSRDAPYLAPAYVTAERGRQHKEEEEVERETVDACLQTSGVLVSTSEGFVPNIADPPSDHLVMQVSCV